MKKTLLSLLTLLLLATTTSAQIRQTALWIDDGTGDFAKIVAPPITGTVVFTLPATGGTLTTEVPGGYLPLSGGTMTGALNMGTNDITNGGTFTATSFVGALTGNASTATKLATARNINGVAFDGTGDITVTADANTLTNTTLHSTVVNSSLTSVGTLTGLTMGGDINLATHNITNGGSITATGFSGPLTGDVTGNVSGNAGTATKLATARNINGVAFDGTGDITVTADANTLTNTTLHSTVVNSSLTSVGTLTGLTMGGDINLATHNITNGGSITATGFSGPLTGDVTGNVSGNAGTATKLATARNINGVAFDGTGDITVTADANTLTNTTLHSTVVNSSLTSVGTLTSLTVGGLLTTNADHVVSAITATLASNATTLDNTHEFYIIPDNTGTPVAVTGPTGVLGKVIIVENKNAAGTTGSMAVPPETTKLLIYDGTTWMPLF